jgi:hypothetical protein
LILAHGGKRRKGEMAKRHLLPGFLSNSATYQEMDGKWSREGGTF